MHGLFGESAVNQEPAARAQCLEDSYRGRSAHRIDGAAHALRSNGCHALFNGFIGCADDGVGTGYAKLANGLVRNNCARASLPTIQRPLSR